MLGNNLKWRLGWIKVKPIISTIVRLIVMLAFSAWLIYIGHPGYLWIVLLVFLCEVKLSIRIRTEKEVIEDQKAPESP